MKRIPYPLDFRKAEHGFALAVREHFVWLEKNKSQKPQTTVENQHKVVRSIIQDLNERIPKGNSPYLVLAGVSEFSDLVFNPNLKWLQYRLSHVEKSL